MSVETVVLEVNKLYDHEQMMGYNTMERKLDIAYFTYLSRHDGNVGVRQWFEVCADMEKGLFKIARIYDCCKTPFAHTNRMEFRRVK